MAWTTQAVGTDNPAMEHGARTMDLATTLTLQSLNTAIGTLTARGIVGTFTLDPMTGIFFSISLGLLCTI